jgi:hypothetical protein
MSAMPTVEIITGPDHMHRLRGCAGSWGMTCCTGSPMTSMTTRFTGMRVGSRSRGLARPARLSDLPAPGALTVAARVLCSATQAKEG